jgi:3-dehydroquinate synthase
VLAVAFSSRLNLCSADDAGIVARHLQAVGLPTSVNQIPGDPISVETLMAGIAQDKKVQRGALTFILTRRIGESFVAKDVPASEVQAFLNMTLAD